MRTLTSILISCLAAPALAVPPPAPKGFQWVENPDFTDEFNGMLDEPAQGSKETFKTL